MHRRCHHNNIIYYNNNNFTVLIKFTSTRCTIIRLKLVMLWWIICLFRRVNVIYPTHSSLSHSLALSLFFSHFSSLLYSHWYFPEYVLVMRISNITNIMRAYKNTPCRWCVAWKDRRLLFLLLNIIKGESSRGDKESNIVSACHIYIAPEHRINLLYNAVRPVDRWLLTEYIISYLHG